MGVRERRPIKHRRCRNLKRIGVLLMILRRMHLVLRAVHVGPQHTAPHKEDQ